jgi:hypothetical protein
MDDLVLSRAWGKMRPCIDIIGEGPVSMDFSKSKLDTDRVPLIGKLILPASPRGVKMPTGRRPSVKLMRTLPVCLTSGDGPIFGGALYAAQFHNRVMKFRRRPRR